VAIRAEVREESQQVAGIATKAAIADAAATEGTAADHRVVDTIRARALLVVAAPGAVEVVADLRAEVVAAGLQVVAMKVEAMHRLARVDTHNATKVKVLVKQNAVLLDGVFHWLRELTKLSTDHG
jgi:hypothetical protein